MKNVWIRNPLTGNERMDRLNGIQSNRFDVECILTFHSISYSFRRLRKNKIVFFFTSWEMNAVEASGSEGNCNYFLESLETLNDSSQQWYVVRKNVYIVFTVNLRANYVYGWTHIFYMRWPMILLLLEDKINFHYLWLVCSQCTSVFGPNDGKGAKANRE